MDLVYADDRFHHSKTVCPLLESRLISKKFGQNPIIHNLSFKISEGEIVGVFGKRYSGKSTLISLISGEATLDSGQILFRGEEINNLPYRMRQENGILRNSPISSLVPELTVRDNLLLLGTAKFWPLFPRQGYAPYVEEGDRILALAGLEALAGSQVETLSSGQKYFLTIAIALASTPALLLLDNPFLDIKTRHSDFSELMSRVSESGTSVLFTAEKLFPAINICDRFAFIHDGKFFPNGVKFCSTHISPAIASACSST